MVLVMEGLLGCGLSCRGEGPDRVGVDSAHPNHLFSQLFKRLTEC